MSYNKELTNKANMEFETIKNVVQEVINFISNEFQSLGMEGLHKKINPSLQDLKKIIKEVQKLTITVEEKLLKIEGDIESVLNTMRIQNIKQGLLFAENLLMNVENLDSSGCEEYLKKLDKNNI